MTCAFAGVDQSWTVPAGVTEATFDVYGAQGGGFGGPGSYGGEATATFNVTPGSALTVAVGESGGSPGSVGNGGFGGGGSAVEEGGGGGASTVSDGGSTLLVAGGGGGDWIADIFGEITVHAGGNGGGLTGTSGSGSLGGSPGTQQSGYQMGQGGPGAGGGGGGGGYWGGDGGGTNGGGGGGSGYVNPSAINSNMETDLFGVPSGNGEVVIAYAVPGAVPTVSGVSPNTGPMGGGTPITVTGTGFVVGATGRSARATAPEPAPSRPPTSRSSRRPRSPP